MRKALIETITGKVTNVILIEDGADWPIPAGHTLRDAANANPGDTWDGVTFIRAAPTPPDPAIAAFKNGTTAEKFLMLARRAGLA